MKRRLITLALLALTGALMAPGSLAAPADQVALRPSVVVEGRIVTLGDLFTGAGEHAGTAVAYSPAPGKRAVYDVRWLYRVAQAYGLNWRPLTMQDQAVVERASTIVPREEVEAQILNALLPQGIDAGATVELSNRLLQIYLPEGSTGQVGVEDITYNSRTGYFSAVIAAPADQPGAQRYRVTGRVYKVQEVPVLARRVLPGEIIRETDIEWLSVRADHVRTDTVVELDELVGKSPKRLMRTGRPVRTRDIGEPILVPKRALVTILYQQPRMTLTAKGRALEDGSEGDTVRIANTHSNTVIEGIVVGAHMVAVRAPSNALMN